MNESDMRNTSAPHVLTDQQIERYARHIALKEFGRKSQNRLLDSNALLVRAGGPCGEKRLSIKSLSPIGRDRF